MGKIINLPLSVRARNSLLSAGFEYDNECIYLTQEKLLSLKNIGRKTADEIVSYFSIFRIATDVKQISDEDENKIFHINSEKGKYLICVLALPIGEINFSLRSKNILERMRIKYLYNLISISKKQILYQKNAGSITIKEISCFLELLDLSLDMILPDLMISEIIKYIAVNEDDPRKLFDNFRREYPDKAKTFYKFAINRLGPERTEFYKHCFELYKQGGTLEFVGKQLGLTRERIRQILNKGTEIGLFLYRGIEYPYISKEKIINDIKNNLGMNMIRRNNGISGPYLKRLLVTYNITAQQIENLRLLYNKQKAVNEFNEIKNQLGHYPTCTELVANHKWRHTESSIRRYWKNIELFRNELHIPSPPPFNKAIRPWIEYKSRIALIKRMQDLDTIRECLSDIGPISTSQVALKTNINNARAFRLLRLLIATGEATCDGNGNQVKYRLVKEGIGK